MEKLSFRGVNIKSSEYINIFKSNINFRNQRIVHGVYVNYTCHELGFFETSYFYNIFVCFNWFLWPIMNSLSLHEFFFQFIYLFRFKLSMLIKIPKFYVAEPYKYWQFREYLAFIGLLRYHLLFYFTPRGHTHKAYAKLSEKLFQNKFFKYFAYILEGWLPTEWTLSVTIKIMFGGLSYH